MDRTEKTRRALREAWKTVVQIQRERASGIIELELKELENIFSLLLFGSFVGLPSPPAPIVLELLPYLEDEIRLMLVRADFAQDPLGGLMGVLEVG